MELSKSFMTTRGKTNYLQSLLMSLFVGHIHTTHTQNVAVLNTHWSTKCGLISPKTRCFLLFVVWTLLKTAPIVLVKAPENKHLRLLRTFRFRLVPQHCSFIWGESQKPSISIEPLFRRRLLPRNSKLILKELQNGTAQYPELARKMTLNIYFLNPKNRILLRHMVTSETVMTSGTYHKAFTLNDHVTFIRVEFLSWTAPTNTFIHPAGGHNKETLCGPLVGKYCIC